MITFHHPDSDIWRKLLYRVGVLLSVLIGLGTPSVRAQQGFAATDKVTVRLPNGSQVTMRGMVQVYTGERLLLQTSSNGQPAELPGDQVLSVETPQVASQIAGAQLFQQGKYADAEQSLELAFKLESRDWVRRDILALMIRCDLQQGDYLSAGNRFMVLYRNDPTTHHIVYLPLHWAPTPVEGPLKTAAEEWILQSEDAIRLMGASYLLKDPQRGDIALTQIRRMVASTDRRVSALAKAQIWRDELQPKLLSLEVMHRWEAQLQQIPPQLRGGPYYVLGQAYYLRRDYTQAAASLLWVPIVYEQDTFLAARSCLEAADIMRLLRDEPAAIRLYQEVVNRFPQTDAAQIATSLLNELEPPNE